MPFIVRPTREDDWQAVRALRLEALRDTPIAYGETLEHALAVAEPEWRQRALRGQLPGQTALAAIEGARWVGLMGGYLDGAHGATLVGVYVAPDRRGDAAGVAAALLDGVEEWAGRFGDALRLEVHEDNPRAQRFYEKAGFALTGRSRPYELAPGGLELEMLKRL